MKRRTSTAPVRIMTTLALDPTHGAEHFWEQLRTAYEYYNWVLAVELVGRRQYREERARLGPVLPALETKLQALTDRIEDLRGELLAIRAAARKRVENPALSDEIKRLCAERELIAVQAKAARTAVEKDFFAGANAELERRSAEKAAGGSTWIKRRANAAALQEMLAEVQWPAEWKTVVQNEAERARQRESLREHCGLVPGTYSLVDRAAAAALKPAPPGMPPKADPSLKDGYGREGRVGVQLRRLTVQDLISGANSQLQLKLSDRRGGTNQQYGTLRMRITPGRFKPSAGGDDYAEFPVKLWRPLPKDGILTEAWIHVSRFGPKRKLSFQFTVETQNWERPEPVKNAGVVALDPGWRPVEGGIRAAYWVDDHNRHGQILVPEPLQKAILLSRSLRSSSDLHFDEARARVRDWMNRHQALVPAWITAATENLGQWRAHGRLIRVARRLVAEQLPDVRACWDAWREARLGGLPKGGESWDVWQAAHPDPKRDLFASYDEIAAWVGARTGAGPLVQLAAYLEFWRRKDMHLFDWEVRARKHAENGRRDLFRKIAQVARQYEMVLIDKTNIGHFARDAAPEDDAQDEWMHDLMKFAAPGDLVAKIKQSCQRDRVRLVDSVSGSADAGSAPDAGGIPADDAGSAPGKAGGTTRTCHLCRHVNKWVRQDVLMLTCAGCGATWDQDENACRFILRQWYDGRARAAE